MLSIGLLWVLRTLGLLARGCSFVLEEKDRLIKDGHMTFEQDKTEESVELLRTLRKKLVSGNVSNARAAAHNLSWLQEDGLVVLKEALLGDHPRMVKQSAAYGLRKVKGRMKKMACEVLEQGQQHRDRVTRQVCEKSVFLMEQQSRGSQLTSKGRQRIAEVPRRGGQIKAAMTRLSFSNR